VPILLNLDLFRLGVNVKVIPRIVHRQHAVCDFAQPKTNPPSHAVNHQSHSAALQGQVLESQSRIEEMYRVGLSVCPKHFVARQSGIAGPRAGTKPVPLGQQIEKDRPRWRISPCIKKPPFLLVVSRGRPAPDKDGFDGVLRFASLLRVCCVFHNAWPSKDVVSRYISGTVYGRKPFNRNPRSAWIQDLSRDPLRDNSIPARQRRHLRHLEFTNIVLY